MIESSQLALFGGADTAASDNSADKKTLNKWNIDIKFKQAQSEDTLQKLKQKIAVDVLKIDSEASISSSDQVAVVPWQELPFIAIDVETTGLDAATNRVIELACVPFNQKIPSKGFNQLFSIGETLPPEITKITGISDDMLIGKPAFKDEAHNALASFKDAAFIVAYNAKFDRPFLESELARLEKVLPEIPWVDPFIFVCELDRYKKGKKLTDAANRWGVELSSAHRAYNDAKAAGNLLLKMADAVGSCSLSELLVKQKIWQWRHEQSMAEYKQKNAWSINR